MDEKKEKKVDNLINLVENHTRTERHLEQYSEIGDPKFKDMAKEKQAVRENQIESLKDQLTNEHQKMSSEEHLENLKENYEKTKNYFEKNFENMSEEQARNMVKKQFNQEKQLDQMSRNIDESGKYSI
ncbi:MAG: hypothetical protein J6C46_00085 [Clostridia bacterium]|nr:hypothetical protein [Clostridia bacterium]